MFVLKFVSEKNLFWKRIYLWVWIFRTKKTTARKRGPQKAHYEHTRAVSQFRMEHAQAVSQFRIGHTCAVFQQKLGPTLSHSSKWSTPMLSSSSGLRPHPPFFLENLHLSHSHHSASTSFHILSKLFRWDKFSLFCSPFFLTYFMMITPSWCLFDIRKNIIKSFLIWQ